MANLLNQFYSDVYQSGLAKPNRYEVYVTPPSASGFGSLNSLELLRHMSFVCESIDVPSQTVATAESKINGLPVIPVANGFSYNNQITMTFKLSEDYRERNMLLLWQDLVYRPGIGFSYYNEYVGSIVVRPMNSANQVIQEFIFRNCFPVAIQDLHFNWASNNENLKQGVTFAFFSVETQINGVRSSNSGDARNLLSNLSNGNLF